MNRKKVLCSVSRNRNPFGYTLAGEAEFLGMTHFVSINSPRERSPLTCMFSHISVKLSILFTISSTYLPIGNLPIFPILIPGKYQKQKWCHNVALKPLRFLVQGFIFSHFLPKNCHLHLKSMIQAANNTNVQENTMQYNYTLLIFPYICQIFAGY